MRVVSESEQSKGVVFEHPAAPSLTSKSQPCPNHSTVSTNMFMYAMMFPMFRRITHTFTA